MKLTVKGISKVCGKKSFFSKWNWLFNKCHEVNIKTKHSLEWFKKKFEKKIVISIMVALYWILNFAKICIWIVTYTSFVLLEHTKQ